MIYIFDGSLPSLLNSITEYWFLLCFNKTWNEVFADLFFFDNIGKQSGVLLAFAWDYLWYLMNAAKIKFGIKILVNPLYITLDNLLILYLKAYPI